MTTTADLPASAQPMANPAGNGAFHSRRTAISRDDYLSWMVLFSDLDTFYEVCFDRTETITISESPLTTITRVVPLQHPFSSKFYAIEAEGRAMSASDVYDSANPWANYYEYCIVTVHFGILPYSFTDRPFVSIRRSGRSSVATLPIGNLKFAGNNELIDIPPGVPIFQEDLVVTWHEVTDLDGALATIEPLAGMVNSADVAIGSRTYPTNTLHFPEFDAEAAITWGGSRKASLTFPVRWRPRPTWMQAIRRDGTVDTITPAPLPTGDLNPLFG